MCRTYVVDFVAVAVAVLVFVLVFSWVVRAVVVVVVLTVDYFYVRLHCNASGEEICTVTVRFLVVVTVIG